MEEWLGESKSLYNKSSSDRALELEVIEGAIEGEEEGTLEVEVEGIERLLKVNWLCLGILKSSRSRSTKELRYRIKR